MKEDYASEENDASWAIPASPLPASRGKGSAATLPTPPGEPHSQNIDVRGTLWNLARHHSTYVDTTRKENQSMHLKGSVHLDLVLGHLLQTIKPRTAELLQYSEDQAV